MAGSVRREIQSILTDIRRTPGWEVAQAGNGTVRVRPPGGVSKPFNVHVTPDSHGGDQRTVANLITRLRRHGWEPDRAQRAANAGRNQRLQRHARDAERIQTIIDTIDKEAGVATTTATAKRTPATAPTFSPQFSAPPAPDEVDTEQDHAQWRTGNLPLGAIPAINAPRPPAFVMITAQWARERLRMDNEVRVKSGKLNRDVLARRVEDYKADILAGRWKAIHQGFAFAPDESILDGQHRLLAVAAANTTVYGWVFFNVDPDTFDVIDAGRPRSVRDSLKIRGENSASDLAALVRAFFLYTNFDEFDWASNNNRVSSVLTAEILGQNPDLRTAVEILGRYRGMRRKVRAPAVALFIYLALRTWPDCESKLHEYLHGVNTGYPLDESRGLLPTDPRMAVHRTFINLKTDGKVRDFRYHLGVLIKGWNLFCTGSGSTLLTLKETERVQSLYRPER